MDLFRTVYYFFSRYTDPIERRVGRFFGRVTERDAEYRVEKSLLRLIQHDLAVVNLWTEHRYKGYRYLTKRMRRQLYANLETIKQDFQSFAASHQVDVSDVLVRIERLGVDVSRLRTHAEQLAYLATIQAYLSPKNGRYGYQVSSSFGRLLQDPSKEKLVGDCNQIVTLYIVLFGLRYTVSDLKLTLYPGHVALHFHGADIETTNGQWAHYHQDGQRIAPVHEIVSVNLLDTTDGNFVKNGIDPAVFLQAARLAYVVSVNRELVKENLGVAYHNAVTHFMRQHDYSAAVSYAKQSRDFDLLQVAAHNGAMYALRQKEFARARRFATATSKKQELLRTIDVGEATQLFNAKRYHEALKLYERVGDRDMQQRCYKGLYAQEQAKLRGIKTTADLKAHAGTIRTMQRYANASGDTKLMQYCDQLVRWL